MKKTLLVSLAVGLIVVLVMVGGLVKQCFGETYYRMNQEDESKFWRIICAWDGQPPSSISDTIDELKKIHSNLYRYNTVLHGEANSNPCPYISGERKEEIDEKISIIEGRLQMLESEVLILKAGKK